jgi:hypothetical protein
MGFINNLNIENPTSRNLRRSLGMKGVDSSIRIRSFENDTCQMIHNNTQLILNLALVKLF